MNNAVPVNPICPFLGLESDADSSQAFASNLNYCHHTNPIGAVTIGHQTEFCLSRKHRECPVFLRKEAGSLPRHLRTASRTKKTRRISPGSIIASIITLILIFMLGWQFFAQTKSSPVKTESPAYNAPSLSTETFTPIPSITTATPLPPTAISTPTLHIPFFGSVTVTSSLTLTPSVTATQFVSRHQLDVEIGTDRKFIIHRLAKGESLDPHVLQYNTSIEAVKAINYDLYLTNPVRRDTLIVFPLNFTNVSGLHVLDVYQVLEVRYNVNSELGINFRGINYEDLVLYLRDHIDLGDFKYYNGITEPGDRPLIGDYFLIPQKRRVP